MKRTHEKAIAGRWATRSAVLLTVLLAVVTVGATSAFAGDELSVTGPYAHGNVEIYLVHGEDEVRGQEILTLDEALADGSVIVRETGDVERLIAENRSEYDVFLMAGDIVKGGRQDRVLSTDLLLPAKSGPTAIDAFCVEQGRWSPRGAEASDHFASSKDSLATRELKLAARESRDQAQVWARVSKVQEQLEEIVVTSVRDPRSASSLQLSLEQPVVTARTEELTESLGGLVAAHKNARGYAFLVNGEISSVDVFASHGLFRKVWPKLLKANAVEALVVDEATGRRAAGKADVEEALALFNVAGPTRTTVGSLASSRIENERFSGFATVDSSAGVKLRLNVLRKE